uniref:Endonuclease/exonuclease/phosphatase domain-containing protein n=1 Tax=Octopus bimaculoides TaxID=37653 RepID=A0A0L8IFJ4_OCTBM
MTIVLAFEEEVVRGICGYGPQSGIGIAEKEQFFDEIVNEWDLHKVDELVLGMGDFNGHVGKWIQGFEGVHRGNRIEERNVEGRMLLEFCDEKELCVVNTWFRKTEKRKVTFSAGGIETD